MGIDIRAIACKIGRNVVISILVFGTGFHVVRQSDNECGKQRLNKRANKAVNALDWVSLFCEKRDRHIKYDNRIAIAAVFGKMPAS